MTRPCRRQHIADISHDVSPDLGRAIARLEAFCATQHDPNPPQSAREIPADYPFLYYADVRAVLAALKPVSGDVERYQHKKRGTIYEVIGAAELQAAQPQMEHAELVIYRGEDGKLWARNSGEFHDGRFERIEPAAALSQSSLAVEGERS